MDDSINKFQINFTRSVRPTRPLFSFKGKLRDLPAAILAEANKQKSCAGK